MKVVQCEREKGREREEEKDRQRASILGSLC